MEEKIKCPCCGYVTLEEGPGDYDICPVCYWEDDPFQRKNPTDPDGANKVCLVKARKNYKRYGACERRFVQKVRAPYEEEKPDAGDM